MTDVKNVGISLRDYFAAQAMNAIICGNDADINALGAGAAKDAYNVADEMIKARNEKSNTYGDKPSLPKPPCGRITTDNGTFSTCPKCGSTEKRKWVIGKK